MHSLTKIVIASHNKGKISEIRELLEPFGVEVFSANALGLEDVEETGATFAENAKLKAQAAANAAGLPAISDDSGLAVDKLDGAPGIYSARWAENDNGVRDFNYGMEKLHLAMQNKPGSNSARFICALALAFPNDDNVHIYEGKVEGEIVWPPRGTKGFGYDPIFMAKGDNQTFGEIEPEEKHAKSHRADAFSKFIKFWFDEK